MKRKARVRLDAVRELKIILKNKTGFKWCAFLAQIVFEFAADGLYRDGCQCRLNQCGCCVKLAVDSLLVVAGRRDGNGGTALDIHQGSISMGEGGEGEGKSN